MTKLYKSPNYPALVVYLDTLGIDANLVAQDDADAAGYNQRKVFPDGRPYLNSSSGVIKQVWERKEWPSADVWSKVEALLQGKGLESIDEPKVASKGSGKDTIPVKLEGDK